MKLTSEEQLLNPEIRKKIIEEIRDTSNAARRSEAKKRAEVYKDNTVRFVMEKLENEGLLPDTLALMRNRASNISIAKKIVNKLARAYTYGATRESMDRTTGKSNEFVTEQLSYAAMVLRLDDRMKQFERTLRLQRNAMLMPHKVDMYDGKVALVPKVHSPWQYDAVENAIDPEHPIAYVLSDFVDSRFYRQIGAKGGVGRSGSRNPVQYTDTEGTTWNYEGSIISQGANVKPTDDDKTEYIFWSRNYHFTTNSKGEIIQGKTPNGAKNPFMCQLPVAGAIGREDRFWAAGGQDIVDTSILVNTLITDMNAILFMQGWGQLVVTAPKGSVPKTLEGGPHKALVLEFDSQKDEARPEVEVVSSNPPIDGWMKSIEQTVALLLSTNNLSPRNISATLNAATYPSGIAQLIDMSESTEDIRDAQSYLAMIERKFWKNYAAMHNYYHAAGLLIPDQQAIGKLPEPEMFDVTVKYNVGREVISEKERLENMKLKRELAITTQVELLMQENPGMTQEEAEQKLLKIKKDRLENAQLYASAIVRAMEGQAQDPEDDPAEPTA